MKSKYVEIASIGYVDFSRSEVGAEAKYLLKPHPDARAEVSKFIKAACSRVKAICELKTVSILIEQQDGTWHPSSMITATIIEKAKTRKPSEHVYAN